MKNILFVDATISPDSRTREIAVHLVRKLNGNVQKVDNRIFVFAPENVDISAEGENKPYFGSEGGEFNPWQ